MGWLFSSKKAQVAIFAIVSIVLTRICRRFGLSDEDANVIVGGVAVVASVWMASMAHVDAAVQRGPSNQINVPGGDVINTGQNGPTPLVTDKPLTTSPAPPPKKAAVQTVNITMRQDQLDAIADRVIAKVQPQIHGVENVSKPSGSQPTGAKTSDEVDGG